MRRTILAALAVALLIGATVGLPVGSLLAADDEATEPSARWFVWKIRGEPAGFLHLRTERVKGDADAPIRLVSEIHLVARGEEVGLTMTAHCRDDELRTPTRIETTAKGDSDEVRSFTATVVDGKLVATLSPGPDGIAETIERPDELAERFTTFFGVFDLVERRPFDVDDVLEFDALEASELNYKRGQRLRYAGAEEKEIPPPEGGAATKETLHGFAYEGAGGRKIGELWVDEDHRLRRAVIDGRKEITRSTEEQARAALAAAKESSKR